MDRLDKLIKELDEYFDGFIILGSIYEPVSGETKDMRFYRGNRHIIKSMVAEEHEGASWSDDDEEECGYDG
jgi:hypothetical protein